MTDDDMSHSDITGSDMPDGQATAARLRAALSSEAAMVEPAGDGLQKIREGVDTRGPRWRALAVALVAAAVLGLAVGGVYFGLRGDDDGSTVVADQSQNPSASAPATESASVSASPSPSDSPSPTSSGGAGQSAYVYYVHDDGQGPRLYREQPTVSGSGDAAERALRAMMTTQPADPDYASPWDDTDLNGYQVSGDTATVDLTKFVDVKSKLERVAVQEIVYTVTANDKVVKKVRLLVNGAAAQGHRDWSSPLARAPMADVQGLVWLLAPKQGATVGSPVSIDGFGTAFEGTISWEARKNGAVVAQGATQGGANGDFGEFHDTVKLDPGDYEISAFESSAENGDPLHIDTKNVTVK